MQPVWWKHTNWQTLCGAYNAEVGSNIVYERGGGGGGGGGGGVPFLAADAKSDHGGSKTVAMKII